MTARLIVNADDFGLTPGINRAIAELHEAGAVTSATLMANGPAFEDAVAVAARNPRLGVGCHIVLTDGVPVSPPDEIPTLLGPDGRTFRPSLKDFHLDVLRGRIREDDVAREASAQLDRLLQHGVKITHIDTHKHTHVLPKVARTLISAAARLGVRAIRNPYEQPWSLRIGRTAFVRRMQVALMARLRPEFFAIPQIADGFVATTQGTLGISATGRLDTDILRATLTALPAGTWELVCHPGYNDADLDGVTTRLRASREVEYQALLAVFGSPLRNPPQLIHYGEL